MSNIICRIGYCSNCERNRMPKNKQHFLVYGSSSGTFKVYRANRNGLLGFTPHIYELDKVIGENVVVFISCAMEGCDVTNQIIDNESFLGVTNYRREVWTLERWNALVLLKSNIFTFMYEI